MADERVAAHYAQSELLASIEQALEKMGKTWETATVADLAPADEFHIGGRPATRRLLDQLNLSSSDHVLDIGCGIGGPSRVAAELTGQVTGIDLTAEYVDTGNAINHRLGLGDRVLLRYGSALELAFDDETFDGGFLIHVGMNIEDKGRLLAEAARVLRPGASLGIYDVMEMESGDLAYPVPWAGGPGMSHVVTPDRYRQAATSAGFELVAETNRGAEATAAFGQLGRQDQSSPLGLHLVMGPTVGTKVKNMVANVEAGLIAPVEMVLRRPG